MGISSIPAVLECLDSSMTGGPVQNVQKSSLSHGSPTYTDGLQRHVCKMILIKLQ